MRTTNEIVSSKVKIWLEKNGKSHEWLAQELNVSKALIGHMLSGNRAILPKRVLDLSRILDVSVKELTEDNSLKSKNLTVQLRGTTSNRLSKQELEEMKFLIEDYISLKAGE